MNLVRRDGVRAGLKLRTWVVDILETFRETRKLVSDRLVRVGDLICGCFGYFSYSFRYFINKVGLY